MGFNLDTCNDKDELESFAKQMFDVDIDKRKKLGSLKEEVKRLIDGKPTPLLEGPVLQETTEKQASAVIRFVFNQRTQSVVMYQDRLRTRLGVDLVPCEQDGTLLA